jgi:hypothetical protein
MDSMGGSELIVPAQAKVMMFAFPSESAHVTMTTGTGFSIVDGFQTCLDMFTSNNPIVFS